MVTLLAAAIFPAQSWAAGGDRNCEPASGSISTNFLDQTTTLGTATGDLAGALGVTVLSLKDNGDGSLTFQNQHHWVTIAGDTLQLASAYATAYPTPVAGLYAARYDEGATVTGGTGRLNGASGRLAVYGAVDLKQGQVVLRYAGEICYAKAESH